MRKTRQAETINAVLDSHPAPMTAFELHARARINSPRLGIATVYRQLGQMLRRDQLVQVELAGQPCRYERAGKAHHHHFVCGNCGQLFALPGCVTGLNKFVPEGFHALRHELTVFGACRDCASTSPQ